VATAHSSGNTQMKANAPTASAHMAVPSRAFWLTP